ncbi:MAG: cytochrome c biogenesis CcdA family protein [Ancalomicrobiaceae bacterium]|nr:cytochrome c biogenesis CcdA family protein [Ancalomicrobiaceae bacterium]
MTAGTLGLAYLAGVLSILSPCVLPLLPIVLGSAASRHRAGPLVLAGGVVLSFVAIGVFVASVGFAIGLDGDVFRGVAAVLMLVVGIVLTLPSLQVRLAIAGGPISNWADRRIDGVGSDGLVGQFVIGLLLGAVWSPCAGPTLGAASLLAAQGTSLGEVGSIMASFGLGAATPLVGLGLVSRQAMAHWRGRLLSAGKGAKISLGVLLLALGTLILTGLDKQLETMLVEASPAWLTTLTTRL